jgi:hypothetical protein
VSAAAAGPIEAEAICRGEAEFWRTFARDLDQIQRELDALVRRRTLGQ